MNVVKRPQYKQDKRRGRPELRKTPLKHVHVNREGFAWAAGIMDGEGHFGMNRTIGKNQKHCRPIVSIGQVDRRMLDRFQKIVGMGKIYGPMGSYGKDTANKQPYYKLEIYGFEQVQALLAILWTWLGQVKRDQAIQVLLEYRLQGDW